MRSYIREIRKQLISHHNQLHLLGGIAVGAAITAWMFLGFGIMLGEGYIVEAVEESPVQIERPPHATALPEKVFSQPLVTRGIYLSSAVIGDDERFALFLEKLKGSNLNAVVVDLKDAKGNLTFVPQDTALKEYAARTTWVENMPGRVRQLRQAGLYTIARIPVFQDSAFAVRHPELAIKHGGTDKLWRDNQGNAWLDPASQTVWVYNSLLAHEADGLGFDEVNFDYVRFPSDGPLSAMVFPLWDEHISRNDVIGSFFEYLNKTVRQRGMVTSVDLFGMVLLRDDGLKIGQRLSSALANFDYVSPMMYPSHYPRGFAGVHNPAAYPGVVIAAGFGNSQETLLAYPDAKIRPWLQDFDIGAHYELPEIQAQIEASEAAGATGWLLWNASNRYTEEIFTADF